MGFNTTVLIHNDSFSAIRANAQEFVDNLLDQAMDGGPRAGERNRDIPVGGHMNAAELIAVDHADVVNIIAAGANYGTVLARVHNGNRGHHEPDDRVRMLKALADTLGYDVRKSVP